ncbi:putative ananain protein [Helianthus annuus]|uniref:Ananain protein n=1 Tax=Helianthus annuus TaxID=4232 RepID=A0A9K3GZF0_HELAN|nr:putative ananain protein [Helianthus annuus]KAJ0438782.1 putative ananain protein [Helianthus annuus]
MGLSRDRTLILYVLIVGMWVCQITSRTLSKAYVSEKHDQWMVEYGRVYKSNAEKEMRLNIFKKNFELIESFNSFGNQSYKLAVNQFVDRTKDEYEAYAYGLMNPHDLELPLSTSFKYERVSEVPYRLDWRMEGAVTKVKNQFQCGKSSTYFFLSKHFEISLFFYLILFILFTIYLVKGMVPDRVLIITIYIYSKV